MAADIAPQLARNSVYYALKSVVALAAMLLVTPYILTTVGTARYGVWALAGVMTSYAQLSDFGITESLVKYAAEYHACQDSIRLNRLVNTAFVFMLFLAVAVGSIIFLILPFITSQVLNIPAELQAEALIIFRLSVIIFLFNMVLGIFASLIVGSQNIGYTCAVNITTSIVGVIGTFVFLYMGWGLRGLVTTNAIVAIVAGSLNIYFSCRLFPELQLNFRKWVDRAMLKQIFTFSWKIQATSISQLMVFQLDRILLSRYLGLEAVAFYEVGSNIALYAKTFLGVLFAPIVPAVSALQAKDEHAMIAGLYNRSFKFMTVIAIPFCFLVIALANPFIRLWMGSGFGLSALTLQLLIPAYLVSVLTGPGIFVLNGINRPDVAMRSTFFAGIANLLLCYTLIKTTGYFGLIIGISIALVSSAAYFITMLHTTLPELARSMYGKILFKPLLFSLPVSIAIYFLDSFTDLANIGALMISSLLYVFLIGILLKKSAYLDDFERGILAGLFMLKRREN